MEISGYCPHCQTHSNLTAAALDAVDPNMRVVSMNVRAFMSASPQGRTAILGYLDPFGSAWWIAKCNVCSKGLLVASYGDEHRLYPSELPAPVHRAIPENIARSLMEGKQNLTVGSYDSAALMARRAVQSMAKDQGAPAGNYAKLADQITWLQTNGIITKNQRTLAEAIRWMGNHGGHENHADLAEDGSPYVVNVEREDARQALEFAEELCRSIHVLHPGAKDQLEKRGKDELGKSKPKGGK